MPAPKVLIEHQNALGNNVEQNTLDTNRVNIQSETTSRFANEIAPDWLKTGVIALVQPLPMPPIPRRPRRRRIRKSNIRR